MFEWKDFVLSAAKTGFSTYLDCERAEQCLQTIRGSSLRFIVLNLVLSTMFGLAKLKKIE
jgi:hypothetical protein